MGFWDDREVHRQIASWMSTAIGVIESSHVRVMRIADNMRNVAVTEGDKVEAQIRFGWEVDALPGERSGGGCAGSFPGGRGRIGGGILQ